MYVCVYVYLYMYVYVYTYVYIYMRVAYGARARCCNTLQHTATHCSTLNTLQHTAKYCICKWLTERGLGVAQHCNTLQHTATYCNTLQHTIYISGLRSVGSVLPSIAVPPKISTSARRIWGVLLCVVVLCIVLQCVLPGATKDLYERASHL